MPFSAGLMGGGRFNNYSCQVLQLWIPDRGMQTARLFLSVFHSSSLPQLALPSLFLMHCYNMSSDSERRKLWTLSLTFEATLKFARTCIVTRTDTFVGSEKLSDPAT